MISAPAAKRARHLRPGLLAGIVLVIAGLLAIAGASMLPGARTKVVGGNLPVDPGATDPLDLSARNSPAVVANPRDASNLVVAHRVDLPQFGCGVQVSLDGGAHWAPVDVPLPDSKIVACFTPDAAFDKEGVLYVAFTSFAQVEGRGVVPDAIWLSKSIDGGRTLSTPSQVGGPSAFHVRLAADPSRPGRLYLAWLQATDTLPYGLATTGNPIVVSRSDDGGATWSSPVQASDPGHERAVAPALAIGGNGDVYVAFLDVEGDALDYAGAHEGRGGDPYPESWSLVVARSSDTGERWSEATVDKLSPAQRFLMLFPPSPALAVDQDNRRVYVAFHDRRGGNADVWLWTSDNGRRWDKARRVNDTVSRDGTSQYLPALAASPNGRLDVIYYDRRRDSRDVFNDVSLQSSFDGGRTFTPHLRLTDRSFDSRIGYGYAKGLTDLGDRLAVVSTRAGALAVWADTRAGDVVSGKQSVTRALVSVRNESGAISLLRSAGIGVLIIGLVVAGISLISARRVPTNGPRTVGHSSSGDGAETTEDTSGN